MSIKQWIVNVLWEDLCLKAEAVAQANVWEREIKTCPRCQRPVPFDSQYCPHCAQPQLVPPIDRRTTQKLVEDLSASQLLEAQLPRYDSSRLVSLYDDDERKP